jgi:hypothetical protein
MALASQVRHGGESSTSPCVPSRSASAWVSSRERNPSTYIACAAAVTTRPSHGTFDSWVRWRSSGVAPRGSRMSSCCQRYQQSMWSRWSRWDSQAGNSSSATSLIASARLSMGHRAFRLDVD